MPLIELPLLFLDVDGPLIPFRARPGELPSGDSGNPLLSRLDPGDGRRLLDLDCELVWATTWEDEANEVVAPRLGLPPLPVVHWPDDDGEPARGVHWKTATIVRWAAGRPFIWLDDELTEADRHWTATHHDAPSLLRRVDPMAGLTSEDFAVIRVFRAGFVRDGTYSAGYDGDRNGLADC